jgi:1-acyl-sn-glycerol-3-phosphate acyltransferase
VSLSVGPNVPRRGNAFSRWLGRVVLRMMGWRLVGAIPDLPKMVLIGGPHTSNMDGVIAIIALTTLGLRASTMIKDSAFHGLLGIVLRWFGAIPINRRSPKGVVGQTVDAFNDNAQFLLVIAPEGTRSAPKEWKRGFYHVAQNAGVPIVPAGADYKRKTVTFGPPLTPSGDYEADLRKLLEFYRDHSSPRHPERLSRPVCEIQGLPWQPHEDDDA